MHITESPNIIYDSEIMNNIKEILKEEYEKLKSFDNIGFSKLYYELEEKFNDIANQLRSIKTLKNEFTYFLSIRRRILYILCKNCEDKNYGHYNFVLELFDFFMEIWDARIKLNNKFSQKALKIYEEQQISFKKRHHTYRREFYSNIYESDDEFSQDEIYKIHESLRE